MRTRYFISKDKNFISSMTSVIGEASKAREEKLEKLIAKFGLVGFCFKGDGTPEYFLTEMNADYDKSLFESGRVNRTGNDLCALKPIDQDLIEECLSCKLPVTEDVIFKHFEHSYGLTSLEIKYSGGVCLFKGVCDKPETPVALVEISESQYTNPDAEQLKTLI